PAVADHDDLAPLLAHLRHLDMHLGHQRAGRIKHFKAARLGFAAHRLRHTMGTEHNGAAFGDIVEFLDKHRPFGAQVVNDELVVHDFMAHVYRRAEQFERALDDVDGAVNAGTETAGIGEQDLHVWDYIA